MAKNSKDLKSLSAKIIARAWKDPRFKERLLKNPRAAFQEFGIEFPDELQIKVVEDKANAFTFVLPPSHLDATQLSDQELEKIAAANCIRNTQKIAWTSPEAGCPGDAGKAS